MKYTIDEAGIHFYIDAPQPAPVAAESVGCAFGSIVELPPIPDAEAVATCKRIADENRAALEKIVN